MDEALLLISVAVFTLLAGLCSIVFNKIKLPPLIGYLLAGIIIANFWHTSEDSEVIVSILSDMGLVLLMFCIGLEINLKKIRKQGAFAIEVAVIQLPLMVLGGFLAGYFLGFNTLQCITLGAIISGSSTAVVMAVLKSQGRLDKEHIEMLVLITIMEDIGQVIILSMITPMLAGSNLDTNGLIVMIISILVFMIASIVVGLKLMPRIINWVSDNVSSEVLLVFVIGLAFGMALLSTYVGLSMAIGAFLMGMMIAACRKSKEINHDIEPMKNLFMAFFFISIGMEISLATIADNIGLIIVFYLIFATLKVSTVFLAYWIGNEKARTGFLSAIGLVAMGEFAFIIAKEAFDLGVIDDGFYTSVIGAALISMIMLPLMTRFSEKIWDTTVSKCPAGLMARFDRVNTARSNLYRNISATSKKSQKAVRRSMTHAYIDIIVIALIEIFFFFGLPPAVEWLTVAFGGTMQMWGIVLLISNFLALSIPIYYLVNNAKFLDELVIMGAKRITSMEGSDNDSSVMYQKFLSINTYLITIIIDMVILTVIPNPIGQWEHIVVFIIAAALMLYFYSKSLKKGHEEDEDDDYEYEAMETVPVTAQEPGKTVSMDIEETKKEEEHVEPDEIEVFIPQGKSGL